MTFESVFTNILRATGFLGPGTDLILLATRFVVVVLGLVPAGATLFKNTKPPSFQIGSG